MRRGKKKEGMAVNYLKNKGYEILGRNVIKRLNQHKKAEYDIIAKRGRYCYAVEVKSGKQVLTSSDIEKLHKKANKIKAKGLLITGRYVKLTDKAKKELKKRKIRWIII
ncbi:hypothetical protein J422_06396 [Methanocaldococcus villosus KIN24-T80]|uniref:Restriction endonuclease type IV Mrr domain-containing protein n=1 Tax=Methanocaldococcus villosus KIN24-T80 TaxID=1069083 RepID=N6VRB4_9EURY|nr:YraN family protein [Methanocaldococcus villosus]ENN95696.1 hypothetical protein J422_06396 [Methanocaldococcus villosus KIN24-T80]